MKRKDFLKVTVASAALAACGKNPLGTGESDRAPKPSTASLKKIATNPSQYVLITDDCISCDKCVTKCPEDAILSGDPIAVATSICTGCADLDPEGLEDYKCYDVCPVGAVIEA